MENGRAQRIAIATVFAALFFVMGLHLPYWPVWLAAHGLSPEQIGVLLALGPWMRVVVNPVMGRLADRTGRARRIGQCLAAGVVVSYAAFVLADGFVALAIASLLLGAAFSPLIPLTDTIAMRAVGAHGGYGQLRSWGSGAFIAASVIGGVLLSGGTEDRILWSLLAASGLLALSTLALPRVSGVAVQPVATSPSAEGTPTPSLLPWFLVTTTLLHASHAMLYGFGTAHWRAAGVAETAIGWLWATGVIAEIALFTLGASVVRRLSPSQLLGLAGIGGLARWSVLASTASLVPLFAAQILHALTFASLHLGALELIRQKIPDSRSAHVTGLYSASSGVALGVGLPLCGWLYGIWEGAAYFVMAAISATGVLASIRLARRCA